MDDLINAECVNAHGEGDVLFLDIAMRFNKPVQAVELTIEKPKGMTDNQFDRMAKAIQEEIDAMYEQEKKTRR